ncbi:Mevalonate-3-kinase [uncultured archaeon]|nr:Mevalonate-3-kinase [uncultured archaeon]
MVLKACAYPGLPVVFAEGFRDYERRIGLHASVSLALTDAAGKVRTLTEVSPLEGGKGGFLVNGKPPEGRRGEDMGVVVELLKKKAKFTGELRIESHNEGIATGSSDSGAAALATALNGFLSLGLSVDELLPYATCGSETAYRSLYGGLSAYDPASLEAELLADRRELRDVRAFVVEFPSERRAADDLHKRIVEHPKYPLRLKRIPEKVRGAKEAAADGDLVSLFSLMEDEARTFHGLVEDLGFPVRTAQMKGLTSLVESWRKKGLNCFWNVAGGSAVYVFCLKDDAESVSRKIDEEGFKSRIFVVGGAAKLI